ncbi:MAG: ribosome-associated translation inhibitor RaiA [Gammaproteobacteria bacterium]|nr:ribosome-associated translation inhibitor RaiA [Gammaproteobacteria bacterium]
MLPVQITIRDISSSAVLENVLRKRAEKLTQFYTRINSCRIVVGFSQKHKHQGKLYNVKIKISVPGKEFVANHKVDQDIYVAIRDAFNAIERQLEEHSRKKHGKVKTHTEVTHGYIARLFVNEGYGFIQGVDGNEYYYSVTNVHYPRFDQLFVGDAVEFIPEPFNDGWQAQHVIKERHHADRNI